MTVTRMFKIAPFIRAKTQKQSNITRQNILVNSYQYPARKGNELLLNTTQMNLTDIMQNEKDTQKKTQCMSQLTESLNSSKIKSIKI